MVKPCCLYFWWNSSFFVLCMHAYEIIHLLSYMLIGTVLKSGTIWMLDMIVR